MKVKICGIRKLEDALFAESMGVDFLGVIFAEKSPRLVDFNVAKEISKSLKKAKLVGVFQNQSLDYILKVAKDLNLYAIQLHGDESPDFARALKEKSHLQILI